MRLISSVSRALEDAGYQQVQTPVLHSRLSGFEKATGFSTFSASLGERLWFRAAPELYLKRLMILGQNAGLDRIFEVAICLRDEYNERAPKDSFDRPEFTLLEAYACESDPWMMESLLRSALESALGRLVQEGMLKGKAGKAGTALLLKPWRRATFASLFKQVDPKFDLEKLVGSRNRSRAKGDGAIAQAQAIAARAADEGLRSAAAGLAYKAGKLAPYVRNGPQGYWYDFLDHAFQTQVVPTLIEPVLVYNLPLESSPLAESSDGIHCIKWELYVGGVRVALAQRELMEAKAQRVRFDHLERLRKLGYDLVPEPDEGFADDLERWPSTKPLIGMGVYLDRIAGIALGVMDESSRGQERMIPNLFKVGSTK